MIKFKLTLYAAACLFSTFASAAPTDQVKPASLHTAALNQSQVQRLAMHDRRDFEEQARGFIAAPASKKITADGKVVWDMQRFDFLNLEKNYSSIHPSLQRHAVLNMNFGLYQISPEIFQVRGFDLANITFIKGDTGWIIFDTLTNAETAKAALDLVTEHLGYRPVLAVVYSHNHADHFGGIRGLVDEADVTSGKVKVIAPDGFMDHAISENIYAGNAMSRRLFYQYGLVLPASPTGHVDQAIGKGLPTGTISLIAPNVLIKKPVETLEIDGVSMEFQLTPNTEAPAEMNTWFPQLKTFWAAENITGSIHNIYTLRGAPIRDSLAWSKYINKALHEYGMQADIMLSSHNWPRWGNERIQEVMKGQRDMYAHLNNQVLHLANNGVTINEIHNVYSVPESQQKNWFSRGYHGSFEHNSRGVLNRYLGYWDANPATLIPASPSESAPLFVEMMGGSRKILKKSNALIAAGKYKMAQEILNKLVYAEPDNRDAKLLLADSFEQLGYQQESPSVRNSFLAAAQELRGGIPTEIVSKTLTPDMVRALTISNYLDFLGILMDARKAEGLAFRINYLITDTEEQYALELSNGALTNIKGYANDDVDLTITIDSSSMAQIISQQASYKSLAQQGKLRFQGDPSVLTKLESTLVKFDPGFEIMPGTKN
ncbi:MAG: alkyl sulfatase BDS1-like metallo-beta-lactamase superfamily hydrolase [Arenicella sp.]|jgi:alkyl sulfatase BDS1-like metallo-beta-lactamase superfamily hydrolase